MMEITRSDIAECAMVGRSAVDKAIVRGTLDESSVLSIVSYIFAGRLSAGSCLKRVTGLVPEFERSDICPEVESDTPRTMTATEILLREYHELMEDPEIHQERLSEIVKVLGYVPGSEE